MSPMVMMYNVLKINKWIIQSEELNSYGCQTVDKNELYKT